MSAAGEWMRLRWMSRAAGQTLLLPGVRFSVQRLTWHMEGGPRRGWVRADGEKGTLWGLLQLLRCGVQVTDACGAPCWWGFVQAVELHLPGLRVSVNLDSLANRCAVKFRDETPIPNGVGYQWQSRWKEDSASVREWGKKEAVFNLPEARPAEADACAARALNEHKTPQVHYSAANEEVPRPYALIHLAGWLQTLDWLYFSETRGALDNSKGGGSVQALGNAAASSKVRQDILHQAVGVWTVRDVWVKAGRYNLPADNLILDLHLQANLSTPLASASISGTEMTTGDLDWRKFTLNTPVTLTPNTYYSIILRRSGALDAANYYRTSMDEGRPVIGAFSVWNGSVWAARVPDADMPNTLLGESETTEQIRALGAVGACGQFFAGVSIWDASGVLGRQFRDGTRRGLAELRELLSMGTAAGESLTVAVTAERVLLIKKAADPARVDLVIDEGGQVRSCSGQLIQPSQGVVGRWARVTELGRVSGSAGPAALVLLKQAEWVDGRLRVGWEEES